MKKTLLYIVLAVIGSVVISCTETLDPTPLDYTKIISGNVSKTWSLRSLSFRNAGDPDWKLNEPCWSDDSYTFYRDTERKFEFKSGSVKCDAFEEKITITDTWSFINANSTLFFVMPLFSDNALPFTVVDIDNNDLVLEFYFNDGGTQSYQLKFDLKDEK
jgi:hypothetical protein